MGQIARNSLFSRVAAAHEPGHGAPSNVLVFPVPDRLAVELQQWRQRSQWPAEEDFIFPNCQGGALCYENFSKRVLALIAIKLGLPKLTFQVLRRSYATRAVAEQKGSLKDVQAQLRHSRPDTTLQNYVKEVPESVFASVNRMYDSIAPVMRRQ